MSNTHVRRNFKDSLFRMIFREKEELLSLYNAINGSDYTEPEALEIRMLENVIYMGVKNDQWHGASGGLYGASFVRFFSENPKW
ncbi:MAG: hypothetical protein SPF60_05430 [Lachnospiraceae bacterium]|nr:hypothetical protein [Lachnospiraceae bacterium]